MTTTLLTDHWHHDGGGWWFFAPIFWIGVWIVIIVAIRGLFWRRRRHWHWHNGGGGAFTVLAERYARGEIDEAEYRERLEVLKKQ
jgi:putative membrane protein